MRLIDADKLIHSIDSAISLREKMGRKNNYSLINLKKIVEEYGEDFDVEEHDAEIRRQTIAEFLIKLHEIMDEKEKEYGVACIESNCDTLTQIEEWIHEQVAEK